jgi:hypothetical protein
MSAAADMVAALSALSRATAVANRNRFDVYSDVYTVLNAAGRLGKRAEIIAFADACAWRAEIYDWEHGALARDAANATASPEPRTPRVPRAARAAREATQAAYCMAAHPLGTHYREHSDIRAIQAMYAIGTGACIAEIELQHKHLKELFK